MWSEFEFAKGLVERDVYRQESLPDLVLNSKFRFASFDEFDWGSSPSHSLLIVAETLVWTGKSGKWVVYGNRSREILVLGTTDQMEGIGWNDLDWAIERFKFVFGESPITFSFCERLEQAYRALRDA